MVFGQNWIDLLFKAVLIFKIWNCDQMTMTGIWKTSNCRTNLLFYILQKELRIDSQFLWCSCGVNYSSTSKVDITFALRSSSKSFIGGDFHEVFLTVFTCSVISRSCKKEAAQRNWDLSWRDTSPYVSHQRERRQLNQLTWLKSCARSSNMFSQFYYICLGTWFSCLTLTLSPFLVCNSNNE